MFRRRLGGSLLVVALLGAPTARGQEPSGPPPPSSSNEGSGHEVLELLPDLGRIGAEVGALGGGSWNPYEAGTGGQVAGFVNLPLSRVSGGRLSYEIFMGLSLATSDAFDLTLGGRPLLASPVRTRLRLLQVSPFGLKYAFTTLDRARLRPYLVAGVDVLVAGTRLESDAIARAAELEERGVPAGEASLELGGHAGAGLEIRLTRGVSLNLDYRFTAFTGENARLHVVGSGLGIHW